MAAQTKQELLALLKENRVCVLATAMPDGTPHTTVTHYSMAADKPVKLFFSTDDRSTKVQNILHNDKAAVVVGWSEETWISAQMRGEIRIIKDQAELIYAKTTHYALHPNSQQFENDPHTVFLVFTPSWTRYSDLGVDPPLIEETDETQ